MCVNLIRKLASNIVSLNFVVKTSIYDPLTGFCVFDKARDVCHAVVGATFFLTYFRFVEDELNLWSWYF